MLLGFIPTPLNQFHKNDSGQQQLFIVESFQPNACRRVIAQEVDHYVRIDQDHDLASTVLCLFSKLSRIRRTIVDIIAILPQTKQT